MTSPPSVVAEGKSVLDTSPHLAHYVFKLLLNNQPQAVSRNNLLATPSSLSAGHHPLSVSSSGESDEEEDDNDDDSHDTSSHTASSVTSGDESLSSRKSNGTQVPASTGPSREEREALVLKIIDLLDNEQEEDVKDLLREPMGEFGKVILLSSLC